MVYRTDPRRSIGNSAKEAAGRKTGAFDHMRSLTSGNGSEARANITTESVK